MWLICMPLAMLLLIYNVRSYSSLQGAVASQGAAATPSQRQWLARQSAAMRAMRRLNPKKPLETEPEEAEAAAVATADSDAAAEPDVADEEVAEQAADGQAEPAQKGDDEAEPVEAAAAAAGGGGGGGGGGDDGGDGSLGAVGSVVSEGLSLVASSAIGTANAAAAAVASIGDSLRQAAGNKECKPATPNWTQRPLNYIAAVESPTWPAACESAAVQAAGGAALCAALTKVAKHREAIVVVAGASDASALATFLGRAPPQVLAFSSPASRPDLELPASRPDLEPRISPRDLPSPRPTSPVAGARLIGRRLERRLERRRVPRRRCGARRVTSREPRPRPPGSQVHAVRGRAARGMLGRLRRRERRMD